MKVLVIKLTSMGDVIHALPAVSDAVAAIPGLEIDWACEEGFDKIPSMHNAVRKVVVAPIRRLRSNWFRSGPEMAAFVEALRATQYDLVIDAQGLIKSASLALFAKGRRAGFDAQSARESFAARFYHDKIHVDKRLHAIERVRRLFASALEYELSSAAPDYGLPSIDVQDERSIMFIHGTTWDSKHWPEPFWLELAKLVARDGYRIKLPHGNDKEEARARRIASVASACEVMDRIPLDKLFPLVAGAGGVVTVDSGLGHLAAAANVPLVGLYGPTDPVLTGTLSARGTVMTGGNLQCIPCLKRTCIYSSAGGEVHPPCFAPLTPERVWSTLKQQMHSGVKT